MRVAQVMTREVRSCRPSDSLSVAAEIMWDRDCGCVPVVNEKGEAIGIVTDRDICMAAHQQNRPLSDVKVSETMSRKVHGCGPGDTLEAAEQIMQRHQIRRLPVLGFERQLLGILSLNDIARAAAKKKRDSSAGLSPEGIEATLAAVCQPRMIHGVPVLDLGPVA